jgi:ketosteroid isomerase-like protein
MMSQLKSKSMANRMNEKISEPVSAFMTSYVKAYGSGSLDELSQFYSEETLIWPNQRLTVIGWSEVRAMFEPSFNRFYIAAKVHLQEERCYGDEKFLRFLTEVKLTDRDTGEIIIAAFRDFALMRKTNSTSWTINRNIDQPISIEQLTVDLHRNPPIAVFGNLPT